jgi:Domain of unknown function (DUF4864)
MAKILSRITIAFFGAFMSFAAFAGSPETPAQTAIDGQLRAFMGMVKSGYTPVHRPQNWDFGRTQETGSGSVMQEVLITDMTGKNWAALYTLEQQPDGSWKITGVSLKKTDAMTM